MNATTDTCTESSDVFIRVHADGGLAEVDEVGVAVPRAGDHLLRAVTLHKHSYATRKRPASISSPNHLSTRRTTVMPV